MTEDVDLDGLIKQDRELKRNQRKTHLIHKPPHEAQRKWVGRGNYQEPRFPRHQQTDAPLRQEHVNRDRPERPERKTETAPEEHRAVQGKPSIAERIQPISNAPKGYALLITGFVSDVSIDDIYNLAQGKKVSSIKTMLKAKEGPIEPKIDVNIEVIMTFIEKEQADAFIREYSDKLLDGKHTLTFQFRRAF